MDFHKFCVFLDKVRMAKSAEKKHLVKEFLKEAKKVYPVSIFPVVRLLVPKLDRERSSYRLKAFRISKNLIKFFQLPPGNDSNLLSQAAEIGGNFGDIILPVLRKYLSSCKSELTVDELNKALDQIVARENDNDLDDMLMRLFQKSSPTNAKWIIQIILKDLKLGINGNAILSCLHDDAVSLYSSNNNLRKVCETLNNSETKLHEIEINLFEAFRPMLSKRSDASNFKKCFPEGTEFFVENKFDGERFQIHMCEGKFKYFSRNGFDYTNEFGDSYQKDGTFTSKLKGAFDSNTKSLILDGELMLWNTQTEKMGSKGMKVDVKKLKDSKFSKYQPCFCAFDILLFQGKVLTNEPLNKRLSLLNKIIKPIEGVILVSKYETVNSQREIVDSLNKHMEKEDEGIVVKDPKSVYKFSDRNAGWYKLKMDYFDDAVHDLDVLMMGGVFGANKKINSFFIGIKSDNQYLAFGRISSGLSDFQLDLLNEKLTEHGVNFDEFSTKSQGKLVFGRETPNVYIEPHQSVLLKIRASELVRNTSDQMKTPYTLRFPRVLEIRDDKPVDECLTMNELLELTQQNKAVIKLNKRHLELSEIIAKSSIKKIKLEVPTFISAKIGDFLKGVKIFVLNGTEDWKRDDIYNDIKRCDGTITYRMDDDLDIILVGQLNKKANDLIENINSFDIINIQWFKRCCDAKELLKFKSEEIFALGLRIRTLFDDLDCYGDSFMNQASNEDLKIAVKRMESQNYYLNLNETVSYTKKMFKNIVAYFDKYEKINDPTSDLIYLSTWDQIEFRLNYGTVSDKLTENVNYVIVKDLNRRQDIIVEYLKKKNIENKVKIVSIDFLY